MLQDQMQLKDMVIEAFIPPEEVQKVRKMIVAEWGCTSAWPLAYGTTLTTSPCAVPVTLIDDVKLLEFTSVPLCTVASRRRPGDETGTLGRRARGVGPGAAERHRQARVSGRQLATAGIGVGAAPAHLGLRETCQRHGRHEPAFQV
jgi:hypothetical protein